jgi:tetratricopeptide (TPR) repeat protein
MKLKALFLGKLLVSLLIACSFGIGYYGLHTYAVPMSKDNVRQARVSAVADQTEVLLNGAAKSYEEGRIEEAAKVLELNLELLVDKTGRYKASNRWKLERVYFLLGKCYHRMEVFDKARHNYEDTLRLNPAHLPAKYNLEMIEAQGGGGEGGNSPDPGKGQIQPKI